jgi:hypothetical protein
VKLKLFLAIAIERVSKTIKLQSDEKTGFVAQRITLGIGTTSEEATTIAITSLNDVMNINPSRLIEEHEKAWGDLLHTGIHLDPFNPDPDNIMPTAQMVNSTVSDKIDIKLL